MINPNFAILGSIIALVGTVMYAWDTLKGRTQPNRVGWSLWALAPLIAFAAELSKGIELQQTLITLSAGVGPIFVLLASFTNGKAYWKIKPFDWCCAALSVAALVLWLLTGEGNIAIIFSVCSDLLAAIPTLMKSYTDPTTESSSAFVAGTIGVLISVLAIQNWVFANYAFPIYLLLINTLIGGTIIVRARDLTIKTAQNKKTS